MANINLPSMCQPGFPDVWNCVELELFATISTFSLLRNPGNLCHGKVPRVGDDWRRLFWEGVQGSEKIQRSGGDKRGLSLGWDSTPPTPVENGARREASIPTRVPGTLTPSYLGSVSSEIELLGFTSSPCHFLALELNKLLNLSLSQFPHP